MSGSFDPYYTWLSIPPAEQPPDHYRLLGVARFEQDPDVISHAADRQMAHLRTLAAGKHASLSQKLLNEVSAARVCLLNAEQKARYDTSLRQTASDAVTTLGRPVAAAAPSAPVRRVGSEPRSVQPAVARSVAPVILTRTRPSTERRRRSNLATIAVAAGILTAAVVIAILALPDRQQVSETTVATDRDTDQAKRNKPIERKSAPRAAVSAGPSEKTAASSVAIPNDPPHSPPPPKTAPTPARPPEPEVEPESESPGDPTPDEKLPVGPVKSPPEPSKPAAPPAEEKSPGKRFPVPADDTLAAAEKEIRSLFRTEFSRKAPGDVAELAKKLLRLARDPKESVVNRYAMAGLASELAAQSYDLATALAAIDLLAETFEVDALDLRTHLLTKASRTATSVEASRRLVTSAVPIIQQAFAADDFKLASSFLTAIAPASRRTKNPQMIAEVAQLAKDAPRLAKEYAKAESAFVALTADSSDPSANLVAGRYLCFAKADWERGLPHLAKGSDESLKSLAEKDAAQPDELNRQVALADQWWSFSEKAPAAEKASARRRAVWWYQHAIPGLAGLARTKALQRLRQVGPVVPPELLAAQVGYWPLDESANNVAKDAIGQNHGSLQGVSWLREGQRTVLSHSSNSVVQYPSRDFGDTFTIALWAKTIPKADNIKTLVANRASGGGGGSGNGFAVFINRWNTSDGRVIIESVHEGSSSSTATGSDVVPFGQWTHIAVAINRPAGQALIYVNGKDATANKSIIKDFKTSGPWRLGAFQPGGAAHAFQGELASLHVFNRELSAREIALLASMSAL